MPNVSEAMNALAQMQDGERALLIIVPITQIQPIRSFEVGRLNYPDLCNVLGALAQFPVGRVVYCDCPKCNLARDDFHKLKETIMAGATIPPAPKARQ